jgi:hypothetical protein
MYNVLRPIRAVALASLGGMLLGLSACNDDTTGPSTGPGSGTTQFSQEITVTQLQDELAAGVTRVEIELLPGSLTAREVEVKGSDELNDEEEIESRIKAIDPAGSVTLELGDLVVGFTSSTRFRSEEGDLTEAEFVQRVQDALAAGSMPPVEAERDPPAQPQDPTDATFIADELKLDDESDDPEIEMNVDEDNIIDPGVGGCDAGALACMQVLDLVIAIEAGVTEIERETDEAQGDIEFEGMVSEVNETDGTVTLMGGDVISIVAGTEIDSDDDSDELGSLAEVAQALSNGMMVEAEGEGVLESTNPRMIVAIEIEFEIEDDADDVPGAFEFHGTVASADATGQTFTQGDGTLVNMTGQTVIESDGDLFTLSEVEAAVAAGENVRAEGDATVQSVGPPAILEALKVKFEVDDGS